MREIKFRAYYEGEMFDIPFGKDMYWYEEQGRDDISDYKIMQYTGLKDKNGTEIYEGDIMKETYHAGYRLHEVCIGEYDNGEGYGDNESGLGVYTKEHKPWDNNRVVIGDYLAIGGDIIGNIYENPELLVDKE